MKLFKNRCYNGGNQHKFEARYSEKPIEGEIEVQGGNPQSMRTLLYYKVYEKDICVWCGKEIMKE